MLIPVPCYLDYLTLFRQPGFQVEQICLEEEDGLAITGELLTRHLAGGETVIFGNPSNPVGSFLEDDLIIDLAKDNPDTLFIGADIGIFLNIVEFGMNVQQAAEADNFLSYQLHESFGQHVKEPGRLGKHIDLKFFKMQQRLQQI